MKVALLCLVAWAWGYCQSALDREHGLWPQTPKAKQPPRATTWHDLGYAPSGEILGYAKPPSTPAPRSFG